jgi:hypothetical protein
MNIHIASTPLPLIYLARPGGFRDRIINSWILPLIIGLYSHTMIKYYTNDTKVKIGSEKYKSEQGGRSRYLPYRSITGIPVWNAGETG